MPERYVLSIAATAIVLATGCSSRPNDATVVTKIQSQMFSDQQLKDASLQVTSNHGEVTLSGMVRSDAARLDAYKIAAQTPGVSKVTDQMTVALAPAPRVEPAPAPAPRRQSAAMKSRANKGRKKHPAAPRQEVQSAYNTPPVGPSSPATTSPAPPEPAPAPVAAAPPQPPQPRRVEIAANTTLTIRLIDSVDSSVNHAGEVFHASLDASIVVGDEVIVPKGADVYVRLAAANSAGKFAGKSELHLELIRLEFRGHAYPLVSSTYSLAGGSQGKGTAEKVGGGAAIGAIIGAIAGGGKGAAIGAGVGGAGGGVYQGATGGKQVRIPSETKLDFQLDQPVTVTVSPRAAPKPQ